MAAAVLPNPSAPPGATPATALKLAASNSKKPVSKYGVYSREEVAKHSSFEDGWIIVDGRVFDVTKFLNLHPGGKHIFADVLGKDASEQYFRFHETRQLDKYPKLLIGELDEF